MSDFTRARDNALSCVIFGSIVLVCLFFWIGLITAVYKGYEIVTGAFG